MDQEDKIILFHAYSWQNNHFYAESLAPHCLYNQSQTIYETLNKIRACLKRVFCRMCVTICGRFRSDGGVAAGYHRTTTTEFGQNIPQSGAYRFQVVFFFKHCIEYFIKSKFCYIFLSYNKYSIVYRTFLLLDNSEELFCSYNIRILTFYLL